MTFTAYGNGYLVAGMGSCTDTVLVIPDNHNGSPIIGIADEAFEGNLKITELVLGENVESIGESAFHNCENLSKIVVNAKLKSVSDFAFLNTDMGTIFDVPSASVWASIKFTSHGRPIGFKLYINGVYSSDLVISGERGVINEYAFESYSWVTSVKIEEGITTIEYAAFRDCNNLTELTIPKSVTTIGNRAFNDCWRLKTIYYEGTIAEWKAISEQMHSFTNVHDDCIVICTDGVSDTSYWN